MKRRSAIQKPATGRTPLNPDGRPLTGEERRARRLALIRPTSSMSEDELEAILDKNGGFCPACGNVAEYEELPGDRVAWEVYCPSCGGTNRVEPVDPSDRPAIS